jgi:hypothetical protein
VKTVAASRDAGAAIVKPLWCVAGTKDHFHISLEDEVVRGSIVTRGGQLLWPPPPPPPPPALAPAPGTALAPKPVPEKPVPVEPNYFANTLKDAAMYTGGNVPNALHKFRSISRPV